MADAPARAASSAYATARPRAFSWREASSTSPPSRSRTNTRIGTAGAIVPVSSAGPSTRARSAASGRHRVPRFGSSGLEKLASTVTEPGMPTARSSIG